MLFVRNSTVEDIRFNELFVEVLDKTLIDILGKEAKRELYIYFKAVLSLDSENISREADAFHTGLKLLFGSGAIRIENAIVKELFSKIGLKVSTKHAFVDLVKKARIYFTLHKKQLE